MKELIGKIKLKSSKVFECILYAQNNSYMQNTLSKYVTGFRKSHGAQHSFMVMLEK